jgi:hypothetical protein
VWRRHGGLSWSGHWLLVRQAVVSQGGMGRALAGRAFATLGN